MPVATIVRGLLLSGLALMGIGLDRLVNSYLVSGHVIVGDVQGIAFVRSIVGLVCVTVGGLLLALAAYEHFDRRAH